MSEIILKAVNLSKNYGALKALENISFEIEKGETHALCGENGAGKSTFIKILTGAIEPSSGNIEFEGIKYDYLKPKLAMNLGINGVYQEFSLVPYLTVAENIFYGREIKKFGIKDTKKMNSDAARLCREMGVNIDVRKRIIDLGVAYQQVVEILKAVSRNPKFIIMDEPTAALTINETEILFNTIINKLKKNKTTILFISHRLEEVFQICDKVTVFCDGKYIITKNVSSINKKELISYMVGRELSDNYPKTKNKKGGIILEVKNLKNKTLKDISFTLREGEILGFGGLVGAGRTEIARAIFGADKIESGKIILKNKEYIVRSPKDAIKKGIGLIPEDRKNQGIVPLMSVKDNIVYSSLKTISKFLKINKHKEKNRVDEYIKLLRIKTFTSNELIRNLSGGNQQKVVLAKILSTNCDIIIFDEPTRGIDVLAKQEIYELICELADKGKSIIIISSEMPELIGMSERIIVMSGGYIAGEIEKENFSQERILEMASSKI